MASSDGPRQGLDRGVAALRWMLVSAQEDASARSQVLPAVAKCTVLVATWANAPDTVRVISGTGSDVSMPLFTGHDALEHAAKRFGWSAGTQSVSFRAINGREALQHAVIQEVVRVVIDAGAEHAFEVTSKEVAAYLLRSTGTDLESTLRVSAVAPPATIEAGTGKMSKPVAAPQAQATKPASEPHVHKKPKLGEIDDPFASIAGRRAPVKRDKSSGGVVRKIASSSQPPLSRQMPSQPFESSRPKSEPRGDALSRQETQPLSAHEMRVASPVATTEPLPTPPAPAKPAAPKRAETPLRDDLPNPAASKPSAEARAAAMEARIQAALAAEEKPAAPVVPVVRTDDAYDFGGPASAPPIVQIVQPVAVAEPARPKRERPITQPIMPGVERLGSDAQAQPQASAAAAPRRRSEQMMPRVETGQLPPAMPRPPKKTEPRMPVVDPAALEPKSEPRVVLQEPKSEPRVPVPEEPKSSVHAAPPPARPASTAQQPAVEAEATPAPSAPANVETLEAPEVSLDDAVLSAMADELRKYPEVEWACELSDGSELMVIGVRVDPSYTARASEIETKVGRAGRGKGGRLQMLLLLEAAVTKNARAKGRMFFPWKKKK
jgi:hypothetical protein